MILYKKPFFYISLLLFLEFHLSQFVALYSSETSGIYVTLKKYNVKNYLYGDLWDTLYESKVQWLIKDLIQKMQLR